MTTARDAAFAVLRRWAVITEPPFLPERAEWADLSPRDRAFAWDLLTGIFRWRGTLDAIIASRLKQPLATLDPSVQAILWLGGYQLLMQEGVTDYAAVDTSVQLARKHAARASGLINAVLRGITRLLPARVPAAANTTLASRLSRRGFALDAEKDVRFNADLFPDPAKAPESYLAAARSHPREYVRRVFALFGPERAGELLLANNQRSAITLRADAAAIDVPAAAGLAPHPEVDHFLIAREGWNEAIERLVKKGTLSPQDPTAAKPVRAAAKFVADGKLPQPKNILDLCAGLGTKSIQLGRAFPEARVTAADIDTVKLQRLAARAKDMKQTNIETLVLASEISHQKATIDSPQSKLVNDLVLIDVPCSNTGVFAKRVQARWRWPTLDRKALTALQSQLLQQGAAALAPAGTLLYSTCSIDPEENQQRIAAFRAAHPDFQLLHEESTFPSTNPAAPHDGGYFAFLTRHPPASE